MTSPIGAGPGADARPRRLASPEPLRALLPLLAPYRLRLAVAGLCMLVAAGVGLAFPQVVRHLLDAAFERKDRAALDHIALLLLAAFALQGAMNFTQVFLLTSTAERVVARLRNDVFAHLVRLSPGFYAERRTGELMSRLSADLTILHSMLSTWVSELSRQSLLLIGGIALLTLTHPQLTGTTLAMVPLIIGSAFYFGRKLKRASTGVQDRIADSMGMANESLSQIRTVQGFTQEARESERFAGLLRGVVTAAIARAKIRAMLFGIVGFIAFAGVVGVLWQGGRLVLSGVLTPGALVSFLLYSVTVAAAVGSLAALFGSFQEAIGATTRVFELIGAKSDIWESADAVTAATPVRGVVALEGVSFRYGAELPDVLSDIGFTMQKGEVVALVGPSGAGKTTIASLIPRFWDVSHGRITLDGIDVRDLTFDSLRGAIGLVPQEPALFSGTIRENIAYADPEASDEVVNAAARAAHATEFIERLPEGLNTLVGERGVKLSGGQRQRIAIARVFLKNPAVVILDEATSSLDNESEMFVEQAMEELLRGRTTLIIAHRLRTVRRADRVLVLERGRIVEEGTHDRLIEGSGLYQRLYAAEFRD